MKGNREYNSDAFSLLMMIPKYALEVYNHLNHTSYHNPEEIVYQQLQHSFSLSVRNDASFIIDASFNLYEHQSTYNPNMPVRSLIYFSDYVKDFIKQRELYGRKPVKIPTPRFAVFYNGMEKRPEMETLLLSNSFEHPVDRPELELICTVYNINVGYNRELLKQCPVLKKYMVFIDRVRYNIRKQQTTQEFTDHGTDSLTENHILHRKQLLGTAINEAIDYCIAHQILDDFFKEYRWEVEKVMVLDYTYERRMELNREEGYNEGIRQGISQGISQGIQQGLVAMIHTLKEFLTTPEEIWHKVIQNPDYSDVTLEQIKQYF